MLLPLIHLPSPSVGGRHSTPQAANLGVSSNSTSQEKRVGEHAAGWQPARTHRAEGDGSAVTLLAILAFSLIAHFDPTPQVVALGAEYLRVVAWSEVTSAIAVVQVRSFDGAGNTVPAMTVNLISLWGVEVDVAFGLSRWLGLGVTGVWWGRAIANLANGLLFAWWFRRGKCKEKVV